MEGQALCTLLRTTDCSIVTVTDGCSLELRTSIQVWDHLCIVADTYDIKSMMWRSVQGKVVYWLLVLVVTVQY